MNGAGLNITGNVWWWLLSPDGWYNSDRAGVFRADGSDDPGYLYGSDVNDKGGVRPVISLKGNLIWKSGDGSSTNPYEVEDLPATLYEKLLADNSTIKTRSDFSTTYTETNTGTLFKSTESIAGSTAETVYYFAGDAKNNWVKFGDFYWRIIRTNHDGSVRLLYSGTSPDTSDVSIGESPFTLDISDIKYTGYMYGTSGTLDNNRTNENNSTIKDKVDAWYSENLIKYAKYISKNAVYCSDRNQTSIYGFTANGAFMKLAYSKNPSYDCTDIRDSFSANNLEAKLIYPIALMTADELSYAGGVYRISGENIWYNCISNSCINIGFWSMSGWSLYNSEARSLYAEGTYLNDNIGMASTLNVRPVISIKGDAIWSKGDGTSSSPYEIVYN